MPEHWTELEALKPKKINNWDSSSLVPITDYLGKGQRILTRGSITRKADFSWGTLMRHQPPESNSVNCSSLADALMIFCYVHCSSDSQCFIVGQTTPNIISSSWGVHLIHGFLNPPSHPPKWHLDMFGRFAGFMNRQTSHATPAVAISRI